MTHNRTSFKKGQSGNPNGRPKLPEDLKKVKLLSDAEIKRLMAAFAQMTTEDIQGFSTDLKKPVLHVLLARIYLKAIEDGDQRRLDFILDRTIGKVVEKVQDVTPRPFIMTTLEGEKITAGITIDAEADPKKLTDGED
jgi:hypothetical protein